MESHAHLTWGLIEVTDIHRAAWYGARIVLRQVSPESQAIFDFILELYRSCSGNWAELIGPSVSEDDMRKFLTYAAAFLSNLGNYFVNTQLSPLLATYILMSLGLRGPKVRP